MKIKVEKPTKEQLDELAVFSWGIWEKEASVFDWEYADNEICYLLEGKVKVVAQSGEVAEFGKGDLVTFPKSMKCVWEIFEDVKKHYKFF